MQRAAIARALPGNGPLFSEFPVPFLSSVVGITTGPDASLWFTSNVDGNIGRYTTNRFIFAPEIGLQAGAYVTSHIKLAVGYNFLYMTDVVRPGTQVDTQINTRLVPASPAFGSVSGRPLPMVTGTREDFHAQGVPFSVEVKY